MPTFSKQLLVIDETFDDNTATPPRPNDAMVDSFYALILDNAGWGGYDSIDNSNESATIPHDTIGQYRIVFLHTDDWTNPRLPEASVLEEYLNVGGRLFIGGYQALSSLTNDFRRDHLGVDSSAATAGNDFIGAFLLPGELDSLLVDTLKNLYSPGLPNVSVYFVRNIAKDALYGYHSAWGDTVVERGPVMFEFEHQSGEFRAAAASFPLYRIEVNENTGEPLATTMKMVLDWLDE